MKYNFTDRTRKVLAIAREESIRLGHDYVGTEHVILALLREGRGLGAMVLVDLGLDLDRVRATVETMLRPGRAAPAPSELPYTSRAKKVLEFSMAAARELGHAHVGTEHLLLGLIREEKGIAAATLQHAGVSYEDARAALLARLRGERSDRSGSPAAEQVWFLEVDPDSDRPLYEQIVSRLEEAVATGRLGPGERLPSVRDLSAELGIAPGTVARAYSELEGRGVVVTDGARGTRVASNPPGRRSEPMDPSVLDRLLRKPVIAAFHRGANAQQMREALERAMQGILKML